MCKKTNVMANEIENFGDLEKIYLIIFLIIYIIVLSELTVKCVIGFIVCENIREPMEMLERDHYSQYSAEQVYVQNPKIIFFKPMRLLDLVI